MKMRVDEVQQGSRVRWRVSARSSQVEHTGGSYIMGEHYTPSCFFFVSRASHRSFSWITFFPLPAPMCFVTGFSTQKSHCSFSFLFLSNSLSFIETKVIKRNPGKNGVENWGSRMGKTLNTLNYQHEFSATCQFPSNDMWIIAQLMSTWVLISMLHVMAWLLNNVLSNFVFGPAHLLCICLVTRWARCPS